MRKFLLGVALLAAVSGLTETASATPEIRPGMALSPEDLPPEAQHYERLLHGDATADRLRWDDDSVDERRHFDDHALHVGFATGLGTPVGMAGAFAEANPWDALALGMGGGVTFWGLAGGAYVRLRPLAWGGHGRGALHAFTLQTSYTYMQYGEFLFTPCIDTCDGGQVLGGTAQFGALSAGFEHQLASGWTFRYDFGVAHALFATPGKCARYDTGAAVPCGGDSNPDTLFVGTFAFSHAL
jgi:hypothetical protein